MKMLKKCLALVLVLALLVPSICMANAVEARYSYISNVVVGFSIEDDVAYCVGEVNSVDFHPVQVKIRLQVLQDGIYETLMMWTFNGDSYARGNTYYHVTSGYTYRVHVTGIILDDDGNVLESGTVSKKITY